MVPIKPSTSFISCLYSYFFLELLTHFVNSCNGQSFRFEVEPINFIVALTTPVPEQHLLRRLRPDMLCDRARAQAFADYADHRKISMQLKTFVVYYLDGRNANHIALLCATIPRLYLRVVSEYPATTITIKIMERRNEFLDERYQFIAEPVENLAVLDESNEGLQNASTSSSTPEPIPYLMDCTDYQLQKMCIAARKRLKTISIIMLAGECKENPKRYRLVYRNGRSAEVLAIQCSTLPTVYLRIIADDSPTVRIMVIFNEVNSPSSSESTAKT